MKARNDENLINFAKYTISEDGTIFSKYYNQNLEGHIRNDKSYVIVKLVCIDGKRRIFYWQRVIWYYFKGEIPKGMQVNHIDENKQNNALSNLNLMTPQQNCNHGTRNERIAATQRITKTKNHIRQFNLDTKETIKIWLNAREIERELGFAHTAISNCCKGGFYKKGKWINVYKAYGYGWMFI